MKTKFLLTLIALAAIQFAHAQNDFWSESSSTSAARIDKQHPDHQRFYDLDIRRLQEVLITAPDATSKSQQAALIVSFPTKNGQLQRFAIYDAPVLSPELSAKYPMIHSYAGRSLDDPTVTLRFSLSDFNGVRGIILDSHVTTFIEPIELGNVINYRVFEEHTDEYSFECKTSELGKKVEADKAIKSSARAKATGPNVRTFRLAVTSMPTYTAYFGGSGTEEEQRVIVLAQINATITQVNAIFERDLSVRLQLVPNNDQLIFFWDDTVPPGTETLQDLIDLTIGANSYDIGHTFYRSNDLEHEGPYQGDAGCIACMCDEGKGLAYSKAFEPESSIFPFIVAHELGHQMGAYHVQSSSECISGNGQSEVEPGSGSTIMGYAGICSPSPVYAPQGYYNQVSIRQIDDYVYYLGCGTSANIGNSAPTANAGADYVIPKSTPFVLTGQGSDPDGDVLTYTWEQNDPQVYDHVTLVDKRNLDARYPVDNKTSGPLFRSYPPSSSPVRLIPNLETVRNDGPYLFEVLPSVSRELNFVLTVRDNNPGGGRVQFDSMKVTVAENAGPFKFSDAVYQFVWMAGSTQTLFWDVAGTNVAPVNCQNVRISLSIDGGTTFPYILASNTPNDGQENVTVPFNISSAKCRLKIEAINNIFYAMSDHDFSVTCGGCLASVPDSLFVQRLGTSTSLAWIRANNTQYEIRYRQQGATNWITQSVADKLGNYIMWEPINNLTPGTTYQAQVRSVCNGTNTIIVQARGTTGQEHINVRVNNTIIGSADLGTSYQYYTFQTNLNGGITVQYDNDQGNRDVQVNYIEVNGEIRQAEDQSFNTGFYANGQCGGGSNSEWLHCNGSIGFDNINRNHITIRARGTSGQEHINLRVNNNIVASYTLTTGFQNYTATIPDTGGITVEYDNDQTNRDVVIDYVIVNGDIRQAEAQSYNTAAYANGQCGGGSLTEWMHCNGLIGFGNVNLPGTGNSGWSELLTFTVTPSQYHLDDINTLLGIAQFNDVENRLDYLTNPDPGTWEGVTWTTTVPYRVLELNLDNQYLVGDLYAGGLPAMQTLDVTFNQITSLHVGGSNALTKLVAQWTYLKSLDLSTQTNLNELSAKWSLLQEIDFGSINQLMDIDLIGCQLKSIDLSNQANLELLDLTSNILTSLDVTHCTALQRMRCEDNRLTSLSISGLPNLTHVHATSNFITSLNPSGLPSIQHLIFDYNELTSLSGLNLSTLWTLDVAHNKLSSLSIANLPQLLRLYASHNSLSSISGLNTLSSVEIIDVDYNNFTTINGLENATSLDVLYASENNLTSLNLGPLGTLGVVYAINNDLTTIVLPSPSTLERLDVKGNLLTEIDVSDQNNLILEADANTLNSLVVSSPSNVIAAGLSLNNLPFSQLVKVVAAAELRLDPMNAVFNPVTSATNITINYSAEAMINGQATTFRWYKNGALAATNNTGTFNTTGPGTYFCEMENGNFPGLILTSETTTITGTTFMMASESLSRDSSDPIVYPNPASSTIVVSLPGESVSTVALYDLLGTPVIEQKDIQFETSLDVSKTKPGIYILKVKNRENQYEKRMVIQR